MDRLLDARLPFNSDERTRIVSRTSHDSIRFALFSPFQTQMRYSSPMALLDSMADPYPDKHKNAQELSVSECSDSPSLEVRISLSLKDFPCYESSMLGLQTHHINLRSFQIESTADNSLYQREVEL